MRLYRLKNRARHAWWMIAATLDHATELSVQAGLATAAAHVSLIGDQTDFYLAQPDGESLRGLLQQGRTGVAAIAIDGAMHAEEVFAHLFATAPQPAITRRWVIADHSPGGSHP